VSYLIGFDCRCDPFGYGIRTGKSAQIPVTIDWELLVRFVGRHCLPGFEARKRCNSTTAHTSTPTTVRVDLSYH